MTFELEPQHRNVSDEELLADLRVVAGVPGFLTWAEYRKQGKYGAETVRKRFGTWNEALALAGIAVGKRWRIPDDELFANIADVWTRLGRQPRRADLADPHSRISGATYEQRFGAWGAALKAFVEFANASDSGPARSSKRRVSPNKRGPRQPSLRLRFSVLRRDRFRCTNCGAAPSKDPAVELHVDHILAWAKGGDTTPDNLRTLCERCNLGKGSLAAEEA